MNTRENQMRPARLVIRLVAVLALLVTTWAGAAQPSTAQSGTSDIAIVTTENGSSFFDACFVLVGYSNEGCDANRDGMITFDDIPYGSYTLRQTQALGGGRYVNDTTINVRGASDADGWERFYVSVAAGSSSASGGSGASDIAIVTTENGSSFFDACFILVGYSNEGCDENRDGKITFDDIPYGSYTLRQTTSLGGGRFISDTTIRVTGAADADGWERFYVSVGGSPGGSSTAAPVDIAIITRDPADGRLLTDVCYVLVNHSNEGCDENNDGQVTFAQIPPGTYTVRQTQTPAGYPAVNAFEITVQNVDGVPLSFLVRQAPEQNAPNTRNVSVVFVDIATKERVVSDICVQFVGASNVGCDEDLIDGQIDFLDVPAGTWEYEFSNIPAGWVIDPEGANFGPMPPLVVDASPNMPSHLIRFIPVGVSGSERANQPESAPSASSGDMRPMSITATICLAIGGSNTNCEWAIGSEFTVTSTSGQVIGSCTLEGNPVVTAPIVGDRQCQVDIPTDTQVIVTLDPSTVPAGYVVEQNPMYFEWPDMLPSYVGVGFQIVPE